MRPDLTFPHQTGETSDIRISYCPERVLPRRIVHELVINDRVIARMTAEMCKLPENSFRDLKIAFANDLFMICDEQKIDLLNFFQLVNRHPRVNILQHGCVVVVHCTQFSSVGALDTLCPRSQ